MVTAIAPHTRKVIYLSDYDVVTLSAERFHVGRAGAGSLRRCLR